MSRAEPSSKEFATRDPNKAVDGLDVEVNDGTADGKGDDVGNPIDACAGPELVSTTGTATAMAMTLAIIHDPNMVLIQNCWFFFLSVSSS